MRPFPSFLPFFITTPLSLLTQTLSVSHYCLIHLIYSYSLSVSLLLASVCSASSAAVAPAHLSHFLSFLEPVVLRQQASEMLS